MNEKEMIEAGISPLPRDTIRFQHFAPEEPAVVPEGLTGSIEFLSTIELINRGQQDEK